MEHIPSPAQLQAIGAPMGPVLVVAGPGAGKTFCLIERVRHLQARHGIAPGHICAVTFTNKAAEEIRTRLTRALGADASAVTGGTLHSLCVKILREHGVHIGVARGFGIADEPYQKTILRQLGVPEKRRGGVLQNFSRWKLADRRLTVGEMRLFEAYQAHLHRRNLLDFDDLIARTAELFRAHADVAATVAAQWDYLLVDEFQDLNPAQYEILSVLAAPHRNFFVVGDDEQSIFSWTGADPMVLVRFRNDYEIAEPVILDMNRRCSRQIFEAARRLLSVSPSLFEKRLVAERESAHPVRAFAFDDEEAEASWILADLRADQAESGLGWGEYAILYRRHGIGDYLESRLLAENLPCRLARGRAAQDDPVIAYVVAALRLMQGPDDAVAVETFARQVLSPALRQEIQALPEAAGEYMAAVRRLGRERQKGHPDRSKLWRFINRVENLTALYRSNMTLTALVNELLSQRVGQYTNVLEENHDELTDPISRPAAVRLAERLRAAGGLDARVRVAVPGGLGLALRGLLLQAGVTKASHLGAATPDAGDVVISPADGDQDGLALTAFKSLQIIHAQDTNDVLQDYVAFDLETTGTDVTACEIVEIGAVRVRGGEVVERYQTLVRPDTPIPAGASSVHGLTDADLCDAPRFTEVWPAFRNFIGSDTIVAHNGRVFDLPVLRRHAEGLPGSEGLVVFDTVLLARSLWRESAKLKDLAERFGVPTGQSHRALDDAVSLAGVVRALHEQRAMRTRKATLVSALDYLGLAIALDAEASKRPEPQSLLNKAKFSTLGRYSDCLEFYGKERVREDAEDAPTVDDVIRMVPGGHKLWARLRVERDAADLYPSAVARLTGLIRGCETESLHDSIGLLLERVALSTSEGVEVAKDRLNLLTLHSTKGLEFSRVYVVGVEDYGLVGFRVIQDHLVADIEEARRLLYVGMTRAIDRLILTRVEKRFGDSCGGNMFLDDMGVRAERVGVIGPVGVEQDSIPS